MKAIIDTHVFLWVITAPEKLSKKAIQIIESKANDIFLSPVSCWEIVIKYQVNKLDLSENPDSLILEQIKESEIKKNMGSGNLFAISFPGRLGRNSFLVMKYGILGYWGNGGGGVMEKR